MNIDPPFQEPPASAIEAAYSRIVKKAKVGIGCAVLGSLIFSPTLLLNDPPLPSWWLLGVGATCGAIFGATLAGKSIGFIGGFMLGGSILGCLVGGEFRRPFGSNITLLLGATLGAVAGFVCGAIVELIAVALADGEKRLRS